METKECEECGGVMTRKAATRAGTWAKQRFCSHECRTTNSDRRRSKTGKTRAQMLEEWKRDREEFVLDIQLLLSCENPPGIEKRMGMVCDKIRWKLRKMGRGDLADQLLAEEERFYGDSRMHPSFRRSA